MVTTSLFNPAVTALAGLRVPTWIVAFPPAATAATATDPATRATWELAAKTLPRLPTWLMIGMSNSKATGPIIHRCLPIEMLRNARTMAGSNCDPAQRVNSFRASDGEIELLYERTAVMVSKASATLTIRAAKDMSFPANPNGYPVPS